MRQLILLFASIAVMRSYAQEKPQPDSLKIPKITLSVSDERAKKLLPQYAPLSPNAWSFQKFGDYQVNLATGVPSIPITLFTVQNGGLSVPITLSYHAGGFKMNEQASWVGWGWGLDFGPSVNRTVQGLKDDRDGGSYLTNPITVSKDFCNNSTDYSYGRSVILNQIDTQPDIFSYKILDKSGKFLLGQNGASPFKIPDYPIQINHSGIPIQTFNLVDNSGVAYTFGSGESQTVTSGASTQNYTSSWFISQIKSPNSDDVINYSYQDGGSQYLSEKQWIASLLYGAVGGYYSNSTSFIPAYTTVSTTISQINPYKITYPNGELEFIQSNIGERQDLISSRYLKQINVYNYESGIKTLIKVIKFTYSYFSGIRLKLDKITVTDASNTATEEYLFDYWTNTLSWNEVTDNEKKDFFGHYNGKLNTHLIPVSSYQGISIQGGAADRSTVDTYMKEGVLKRITFPTKGYTEFDYETNKYNDGTNNVFAGGLRVKSIKSYSGSTTLSKRYEYSSSAGAGVGRLTTSWTPTSAGLPSIQYLRYDDQEGTVQSYGTVYQASFTQSGGVLDLNTMDAAPVYYTDVTEYFEDASDPIKNGKNAYSFDFRPDLIVNTINYQSRDIKPWKRGNLQSKTTYNAANNVVASLGNSYQEYKVNTRLAGAFVNAPNVYSGFGVAGCPTGLSSAFPEIVYGSVYYQTGINLVVGSSTMIDNVFTSQSMVYDSNLLVTQSQSTDSQTGESKTESFIYPSDASYASSSVAQSMVTRNMLNIPLETSINETISGTTSTIYKEKKVFDFFFGSNPRGFSNNILVKELWSAPKGGTLEKRVSFTDYASNGNPLGYVVDDMPISLVWGYNDALLLAEIKNATKSQTDAGLSTAGITPTGMSSTELSSGQLSQLQSLRNALSNSFVSWYSYRPQVGLSGMVSSNGIVSRFSYDKLNRLRSIKDHNSYVTDLYSYVYASTNPNSCTTSAPNITVSSSTLCNATLTASNCSGTVNWSNGTAGNSITVSTKTSMTYTATCTASGCTSPQSNSLVIPSLPTGWSSDDIGTANGCTQYNSGVLTLSGSGNVSEAPNGTTDSFHWIYKQFSGDVTIIAKVSSIPATTGNRVGIMLRNTLSNNSTDFSLFQDGNTYVGLYRRESDGTANIFSGFQQASLNATWIKIVKTGTQLSYYYSTNANPEANNAWLNTFALQNGATFPQTLSLGSTFYVGFAIWGSSNQSSLSNISINGQSF